MHSIIGFKTIIGTQKSVYGDLSAGKLEEVSSVRTMLFPHQQGFDSDSQRGFPVAIDYLPTLAFEQGVVIGMPFSQSTAVATPFARMVGINNFKYNLLVKASGFKQLLKRIERNAHDFLVEAFSFSGKSFEVFNRNTSIKLQSHIGDIPDNFAKPVCNKVMFPCFDFFKASFGSLASFVRKRLQFFFSFKNLFSLNPDILSKVGLLQNFSFRRENGNSKALAINVYSKNILSFWQFGFFFGKIGNDLPVSSKPIGFAFPPIRKQTLESLKVPVFLDWNRQAFSGIHSKFDKKVGFGFKGFAVSGNIELDSDLFDTSSFALDNASFNIANNLGIKEGVFFAG